MNAHLEIPDSFSASEISRTRGMSEAADYVTQESRHGRRWLESALTLGRGKPELLNELFTLAEGASQKDWDGCGAEAVSRDTYCNAFLFLEAIPFGFPMPTVGVEADGQVAFDWYGGARKTLSVSVSTDRDLHYAALIGPSKSYGTEPFLGELPKPIVELVRRICR